MDVETQKQLITAQGLRKEVAQIAQKLSELDVEVNEHALVLDTIKEMDNSRRCYRLIHGVLVERTVGEVRPEVQENKDKIDKLTEMFRKQLQEKEGKADEILRSVQKSGADLPKAQQEHLLREIQAVNSIGMNAM